MATFTARRREPELVTPARATPHERKYLSDIDNQRSLRFYATFVEFFHAHRRPDAGGHGDDGNGSSSSTHDDDDDPVGAIRSALAEALVYYYPIAGRLTELPEEGKLVVDCTAEGVVFVEADADTGLEELGEPLLPPYPCVEEFLCDPGDTQVVVGKPLVFLQVTRLKHGAFVLGFHICHSLCDGFGVFKFIKAVCDIARGEATPAVTPLWGRELFTSSLAPRITRTHLPYEPLAGATAANDVVQSTPPQDMVGRYFFFGPADISALRLRSQQLPSQQLQLSRGPGPATTRPITTFELLTAATWKCRTAALGYPPEQRVRLMFTCNSRGSWKRHPPVPEGFYGCAVVLTAAETTAGDLRGATLGGAVELVRRAKFDVCDEYVRSTADLLAARRWPPFVVDRTYVVSDITAVGEEGLDFGWAKRAGGGVPLAGDVLSKLVSYFMRCRDARGQDCVAVPMYLPRSAMDRFAQEISALLK